MVVGPDGQFFCACGDKSPGHSVGKHPSIGAWQRIAAGIPVRQGEPYGILCGSLSGVSVVDCDSDDAIAAYREAAQRNGDADPWVATRVVLSGKGAHFYYSHAPDVVFPRRPRHLHDKIDNLGMGGYVVGPGVQHHSGRWYTLVNDVPMLPLPAWLVQANAADKNLARARYMSGRPTPLPLTLPVLSAPAPVEKQDVRVGASVAEVSREPAGVVVRTPRERLGLDYLASAPIAIEGQGGSDVFWRVCLRLVRGFELPPVDAARLIVESGYNDRCVPPWSAKEIAKKVDDVYLRSRVPAGGALEPPADFIAATTTMRAPVPLDEAPSPMVPIPPGTRRVSVAGWTYSFLPGVHIYPITGQKLAPMDLQKITQTLVTHPQWAGVWQFDELANSERAVCPPMRLDAEQPGGRSVEDAGRVRLWFAREGASATQSDVEMAISLAARHLAYHPVREYLDGLPDADLDVLPRLARLVCGSESDLECKMLQMFCIGAVRRVRYPGTKMDNVLVLVGEKGYRKSTFVRELFGAEWTLDSHIDLANKDGLAILEGAWGAELSELAGVRKVDKETMKSYLRQRVDKFRPAYQPRPITRPRQVVFVGTANPGPFLQEEDRVFWILKILQKIDTLELRRLRDQIWAEAKTAEARGEPHWFEDDSETASLREEHIESDVWEEDILDYMVHRSARVSIRDILDAKLKMDLKDCSAQDYRRVATVLRRIGCKTVQVRGRAVWWLPDELKTRQ